MSQTARTQDGERTWAMWVFPLFGDGVHPGWVTLLVSRPNNILDLKYDLFSSSVKAILTGEWDGTNHDIACHLPANRSPRNCAESCPMRQCVLLELWDKPWKAATAVRPGGVSCMLPGFLGSPWLQSQGRPPVHSCTPTSLKVFWMFPPALPRSQCPALILCWWILHSSFSEYWYARGLPKVHGSACY